MATAGDGDRSHLTKAYLSGGHSDDRISDTGANARSGAGQGPATERPSDETNRKQLDMARQEGKACFRSLLYMAHEVAHSGDQQRADDYIVAYAQGEAEGMYILRSEGELERVEPRDANCHLEISTSDAGDRRFIPSLRMEATLTSLNSERIGLFEMPFLWHPGLYHYGRNIHVPEDGCYTLQVRIAPPTFMRHDKANGRRYARMVAVEFKDILIKAGRK